MAEEQKGSISGRVTEKATGQIKGTVKDTTQKKEK